MSGRVVLTGPEVELKNVVSVIREPDDNVETLEVFPFRPQVVAVRKALLDEVNSLPAPYRDLVAKHFLARSADGNAAEVAPWLVADVLGIHPTKEIERLATAWLLVHLYALITDDCLDEADINNKGSLHVAAGLCLQRGLTQLYRLSPGLLAADEQVTDYFDRTAIAVYAELNSDSNCSSDSLLDKMAFVQIWTLAMAFNNGFSSDETESALDSIRELAGAFQVRDDLIDWERDWLDGRNSALSASTLDRCERTGLDRPPRENGFLYLAAAIETSAFQDLLMGVSRTFKKHHCLLAQRNCLTGQEYLRQRIVENNAIQHSVSHAFQVLDSYRPSARGGAFRPDAALQALPHLRSDIVKIWGPYSCH